MLENNMVQFGIMPNCCNKCDFCLLKDHTYINKNKILENLKYVKKSINEIDWKNEFTCGISILGGELYFMQDQEYQDEFMSLIDLIIDKVLLVSDNPLCRYSTVTNGMYDPTFLFKVVDRIKDRVGINKVDVNFSFDFKYRFKNEETKQLVLKNINEFHRRYNYKVGVQMIMTQYLIDMWKNGEFDINEFVNKEIPGNMICFLYPHPVNTGKQLDDFFFTRKDFLKFICYLKDVSPSTYGSFLQSTKNSSIFKYTGRINKLDYTKPNERPILADGKEVLNSECGHSVLYQCYSDSKKCMLCDLINLDKGEYL